MLTSQLHKELLLSIFDLFEALAQKHPDIAQRDEYWWPNSGSFDVIIGAILTQQTKWENVEKSLAILRKYENATLEKIAACEIGILANMIRPSGFYNMKAQRLKKLCVAILNDFGDFENFCTLVSREWLLNQKGIGMESADSILCYGCKKDIMVVDSYTFRLLKAELNIEDMGYDELRETIELSLEANYTQASTLLGLDEPPMCKLYALFHGMIVEFCKTAFNGQTQKVKLFG